MQKINYYKIYIIFFLIFMLTGCDKITVFPNDKNSKIKTIENIITGLVIDYYSNSGRSIDRNKILVCKIKPYESGYLALTLYAGEGPQLVLFYIDKDKNNNYLISKKSYGELAISMGFSANRVVDNDNTIIFGNLNESTWMPSTDKRKLTNYSKMTVKFENGKLINEDFKTREKGYIILLNSNSRVVSILLYDSKNQIVNSLEDFNQCGNGINDTELN
ncbi:hypothetical protein [Phosphitispora sp. TUW77]|uniref:hypothetical protein n=1 Tax=Phosphitispora sp. TUW77 TaxID=3152361 RepID=UPI003AB5AD92